jgi:hypothetical protein
MLSINVGCEVSQVNAEPSLLTFRPKADDGNIDLPGKSLVFEFLDGEIHVIGTHAIQGDDRLPVILGHQEKNGVHATSWLSSIGQQFECSCSHDWNLPVANGFKSVQPMGHPISHSAHSGFRWPPSSAITE